MSWWTAFALTQCLEMPVYWWGTREVGRSAAWRITLGFGCSALTHPVVWFVLPVLLMKPLGYGGFLVVAELFAFVVEALLLRRAGVGHPWRLAFVANALSLGVGLVLHALG